MVSPPVGRRARSTSIGSHTLRDLHRPSGCTLDDQRVVLCVRYVLGNCRPQESQHACMHALPNFSVTSERCWPRLMLLRQKQAKGKQPLAAAAAELIETRVWMAVGMRRLENLGTPRKQKRRVFIR